MKRATIVVLFCLVLLPSNVIAGGVLRGTNLKDIEVAVEESNRSRVLSGGSIPAYEYMPDNICVQTNPARATYYVDTNGNDFNPGSSGLPFQTLQKGVSVLAAGDTLVVRSGTYSPTTDIYKNLDITVIGTSDNYVVIKGEGRPIIEVSSMNGVQIWNSQYLELRGFEVRGMYPDPSPINPNDTNQNGNGISVFGNVGNKFIRVVDNHIHHVGGNGIGVGNSDQVLIAGNKIWRAAHRSYAGNSGIAITGPKDFFATSNYGTVVAENLVYDVENLYPCSCYNFQQITDGNGIIFDYYTNGNRATYSKRMLAVNNVVHSNGGRGIHAFNFHDVDVMFNTAYGNLRTNVLASGYNGEYAFANAQGIRLYNNIAVPTHTGWALTFLANTAEGEAQNNILYGQVYHNGLGSAVSNNLNVDPLFINSSFGSNYDLANFDLQAGSPAIDIATTSLGTFPVDFAGGARPIGSAPDVGAYESGSAGTPSPTPSPTTPLPTKSPTPEPTPVPTPAPTPVPTLPPSKSPTPPPTDPPTPSPTKEPSPLPTPAPTTPLPTNSPSPAPTPQPTIDPTPSPTPAPTTASPTEPPTPVPTALPTKNPTPQPSPAPTTGAPTPEPTPAPTAPPTPVPTALPTGTPTPPPTAAPTTASPTPLPTPAPTVPPTPQPTASPTKAPTTPQPVSVGGTFEYIPDAALVQSGTGNTYYVKNGGNDYGSGLSVADAFQTLKKGVSVLNPGDTLLVLDGTYNEYDGTKNLYISKHGTATDWIVITAYPGDRPKIQVSTNNGVELMSSRYVEFSGFEVTGEGSWSHHGISVYKGWNGDSAFVRLVDNVIHHTGSHGIAASSTDQLLIARNKIYSCTGGSWQAGIHLSGLSDVHSSSYTYGVAVAENEIYDNVNWNGGEGILIGWSNGGYSKRTLIVNNLIYGNGARGIFANQFHKATILQNTLYGNTQTASYAPYGEITTQSGSLDVDILGNIIQSTTASYSVMNNFGTSGTIDANVLHGASNSADPIQEDGSTVGGSNLQADPQMQNPQGDNFRLLSTSPAIDAGSSAEIAAITVDYEGTNRPKGAAADAGAFESY